MYLILQYTKDYLNIRIHYQIFLAACFRLYDVGWLRNHHRYYVTSGTDMRLNKLYWPNPSLFFVHHNYLFIMYTSVGTVD